MNSKELGGPAFPVHPDMAAQLGCVPSSSDAGMSLRDYFAAKAMQSLITAPNVRPMIEDGEVSWWAYKMADAMLKAREK
jgi:hypothetical protein